MGSIASSIIAGFTALRPRTTGVQVKFTIARLPIPKIRGETRDKILQLTGDESAPGWANLFFALSFLPCVDLVAIDIRNTLDRPTGHVEIWAPGVRLWHIRDYQKPPLDSKLALSAIEPHCVVTITSIIYAGGSHPDIRVFEDGRHVAGIRQS